MEENTPGTRGGPGGRDRIMEEKLAKSFFLVIFFYSYCIYLLVMPKYWGKQILSLGSFPKVGQKQNGGERKREKD